MFIAGEQKDSTRCQDKAISELAVCFGMLEAVCHFGTFHAERMHISVQQL